MPNGWPKPTVCLLERNLPVIFGSRVKKPSQPPGCGKIEFSKALKGAPSVLSSARVGSKPLHSVEVFFPRSTRKGKDKTRLIISDEMKTEGSRRTLPLIPDVEEILLRHKKRQEGYQKQFRRGYSVKYLDMVCVDQMGNLLKPNYVTTRFPEVLKKYGLRPIRFHDLRHTCASLLVAKNINMKIIQVWLGHSNMSTTADIYSHLDANAKSEAGRAIESVLSINSESED